MFRIFCCRSRNPSRVEIDEVTDSLERCLSVERGVVEFKLFLERNHFEEASATLAFTLKCQRVLTEISRLSPFTRAAGLPLIIQNDITHLYEASNDLNFDADQMNTLQNLLSNDIESKVHALQAAQGWAVDLLQDIYKIKIGYILESGAKYLLVDNGFPELSQTSKIMKSSSLTAVLFLALLNLEMCLQGNARRFFKENLDKSTSASNSGNLNYEPDYHECYILVQETKKVGGHCVKIRDNFQGCVAGSLMDPFHQDCL